MSAEPDFKPNPLVLPDLDILQLALEQLPDDFALLTTDFNVEWIGPRFAARLGCDVRGAMGRNWFDLHQVAATRTMDYARAAAGELFELPIMPMRVAGALRFFRTRLQPLWLNKAVRGILVIEHDLTDKFQQPQVDERRIAMVRTMARGSSDIITLLDANARVMFVSDSITEVLGYRPEQLVGTGIFDILHPEDLSDARERIANGSVLLTPMRVKRYRGRHRHADGSWRWIESLAVNALLDPLVASIIIYSKDVTEIQALDEQLARRERRFATLTERSDDLIVVLDPQFRVSFESASTERTLGHRIAAVAGSKLLKLVHQTQRREVLQNIRELMRDHGVERRFSFMIKSRDARYRWLEVSAKDLIEDPDVGGMLFNARDVTDRKLIELELSSALDGGEISLWDQDLESREIRWLNDCSMRRMFENLREQHGEVECFDCIHPEDRPAVAKAYDDFEANKIDQVHIEYRLRTLDGSYRWILERARYGGVNPDTGSRRISGVSLDVTDRHDAEEALARTRERFTLALQCAQVGFYEYDLTTDVIQGLDAWLDDMGLPSSSGAPGHNARWLQRMHPDARSNVQRIFKEHFAGSTPLAEAEYRLKGRDGQSWVWILDRAQVIERDSTGRPLRLAGIVMNIDARRTLEAAVDASQSRLATAIWGGHFGLWELEVPTMKARWFSDWCAVEGIAACTDGNHVEDWDRHIHVDDLPAAALMFSQMLAGEIDAYEAEYRVRTLNGDWRWISERCRAVQHDADGKPTRVVGICINIDTRKLAEIALQDSQLKLQSLADNSPDWMQLVDTDLRIQFVNRPMFGTPVSALLGRITGDNSSECEQMHLQELRKAVIAEGRPWSREQFDGDPSDPSRVLLHRAQPVRADGRVVGAVLNTSDVTERVRQERMLRLQGHILETMREGVVLLDADDNIRITNPSFSAMFGSQRESLVGRAFADFLPDDLSPRAERMAELRRQLQRARSSPLEFDCRRLDGTLFAAAGLATPTSIGGKGHLLLVLSDVTDRKLLEREILEISNREQQRIGADLHDGLGQELTGVALMLRGLAASIHRDYPAAREGIDEIVGLVSHAIEVTRTLARGLSPVSIERGGLVPALRTLAARSSEAFDIKVTLRSRMQIEPRIEEGVANHLYRIVQEALSNALRHGKARDVRIHLASDVQSVRLSITDDGRGINPDDSERGGLGLRTMNYRAQVIGGHLEVRRHPGGGTVVRCVCPQGARVAARITRSTPINRESAP